MLRERATVVMREDEGTSAASRTEAFPGTSGTIHTYTYGSVEATASLITEAEAFEAPTRAHTLQQSSLL